MGRRRKLSNGKILTAYVDYDEYMQILMLASKLNKSVSETVRLLILSGLASQNVGNVKSVNGGVLSDIRQVKSDLLLDEARERLNNIKLLMEKMESMKRDRATLKYFELKQTIRKQIIELLDFMEKNGLKDEKLTDEVKNIALKSSSC
jgi:coenzyme F420-reducing hydrogenase alpha subunit